MDKKTQALVEQYAKSLVEVALENDRFEEIQSETEALLSVFEETDLNQVLKSLATSRGEKVKLVRLLQESSSPYLNNFLEVILQNERESLLFAMLSAVKSGLTEATNQHDVQVTSAVALTEAQKERIQALVAKKFGVKVGRLVETVDETILGGFVISVNNKVIDTSLRRQLQQVKMNLK